MTKSEKAFNKNRENQSLATKDLWDEMQGFYNEARKIQNKIDVIEKKHRAKEEKLRFKIYQENPKSDLLNENDKQRFNEQFMASSLELAKEVGKILVADKREYDEDDLYRKVNQMAGNDKIFSDHYRSFIYEPLNAKGLYIHGM